MRIGNGIPPNKVGLGFRIHVPYARPRLIRKRLDLFDAGKAWGKPRGTDSARRLTEHEIEVAFPSAINVLVATIATRQS